MLFHLTGDWYFERDEKGNVVVLRGAPMNNPPVVNERLVIDGEDWSRLVHAMLPAHTPVPFSVVRESHLAGTGREAPVGSAPGGLVAHPPETKEEGSMVMAGLHPDEPPEMEPVPEGSVTTGPGGVDQPPAEPPV